MLESLTDYISSSYWTYAVIFGLAALDVVFPLVPSETSVILAGVLAATGDLYVQGIIAAAALGAIVGDNVCYWIGRLAGEWIVERHFTGERRKRLDWAERQIDQRGGYLIVIGRFIPGGRTAVTLASGLLEMPWRRFIVFDVIAGLVWGSYAALLGYFGGKQFEESPLKAFIIAFAVALAVSGLIEAIRWFRKQRAGAAQ
ncbi:MAG TPA: DedA family protein [Gaiellaceae bacterium]|jgi:membrane protein DedA with SNARE-associated domain